MPRRVITAPGHTRDRSLGWLAVWWIEELVVHGPGDVMGQRATLVDEYAGFVVDCYALDGRGRRLYDSAFFSRPKGTDKSGLAAKLVLFEAFGPSRFAGWAKGGEVYEFLGRKYTYAAGEPMGKAVKSPFIRVLATEEEQTGNVYATIYLNLTNSAAPLFELQAYGVQANLSNVLIPWGGEIRRSTAGSASKDGGIETFVVFDETHLYNKPVLRDMYNVVRDNLGKRSMSAEPWYLEATTMYAPGEDSVAEATYALADAIEEGRARRARLLFDHRYAVIKDLRDERALAAAFLEAYGEAIAWNPVEGLLNGAYDPRRDPARTRRLFLNAVVASANAWVQVEEWSPRGVSALRKLSRKLGLEWMFTRPWNGDEITLGFDGSSTNDATALIACRVRDRYLFPLLIEETPDGPEAKTYVVDRVKVDAAVARAFKRYKVVGFYADPPLWQDYVDAWAKTYESQLVVKSSAKHAIAWWTKRDSQMATALERLHTAIVTGEMSHDDETRLGKVMTRHFHNARKWVRSGGTVIGKQAKNSPKKIDAAVAAALAFEAAADYAAKKPDEQKSSFVPIRVR
jgi:hypothetical protein